MEFLAPWALVGLALVPAIFLWALWAPRGRPVTVGSLMLWRRVLAAGPAGKPSARVRLRDPLLWLDAAAVLLVVLACARPAMKTVAPAEPVATLVIDRAAHMWIATNGPLRHRYNGTLAMVSEVLNAVGGVPLRVVSVPGPRGAAVTEEMQSRDFLACLGDLCVPVMAAGDVWPPAVAEAASRPGVPVVVVTGVAPARTLPPTVFVLAPGGRSRNAGLTRVAARIEGSRAWLLVEAKADPDVPGPCRLVVSGDGKMIADKAGFLDPGKAAETIVEIPGPLPKQLRAELYGPQGTPVTLGDGFPLDNSATLALAPASGVRVLLVGRPDPALRRALAAREGTEVVEAPPGGKVLPGQADLVVACAAPLPADWTGPAAVILPPEAVGPVRPPARSAVAANGDGSAARAPEWHVVSAHPLAEGLYLEPPRLAPVRRYTVASGAQLLLGMPDAPLMVTWESQEEKNTGGLFGPGQIRRLAVLFDFDEQTTDWPRRAGFPVFWSHAVDWLVPKERRPAEYKYYLPFEPMPGRGRLAPAAPGFYEDKAGAYGVSFIGTDEGFQSGPGRDDSKAAVEAIRRSIEANRRAALSDLWPWLAAAALVALLARAWVAR
jgi:hypothetical protein